MKLIFSLLILICVFFPLSSAGEREGFQLPFPRHPAALRLVEKELVKLQEHELDPLSMRRFFDWLVLEYYVLRGGVSDLGARQIEGYEVLKNRTESPKGKAYYECQMWLLLDRDLKLFSNQTAWQEISELPRVESAWLRSAPEQVQKKAADCFSQMSAEGRWIGAAYQETLYDLKVARMLRSASTLSPFLISIRK
ncbi:MAG: hypothetical protein HY391_05965 [Deltaproteobacteria bacterium]|nr:hypothetical protein [Deltaproteobacteria bacterium]